MNHIETLKQHKAAIAALDEQRQELQRKWYAVGDVSQEIQAIDQQVLQVKSKRRSLLGRLFLGEPVDVAPVDAELSEAQQQAADLAPKAEGASAARELLQWQLDDVNKQAADLHALTTGMQWAVMRDEVGRLAHDS